MTNNKLTVLCIIDGWGVAAPYNGNAVTEADLPNINKIISQYPVTTLEAGGEAVGLEEGLAGNSRQGHFVIGTGQRADSDLLRINNAIRDKTFFKNKILKEAVRHAEKNNSSIHILGLVSEDKIHSSFSHLLSLMDFFKKRKEQKIYLDLIISEEESSLNLLREIQQKADKYENIEIATISGSFYAMDGYGNWDRTIKFYQALAEGECKNKFDSISKAVEFYNNNKKIAASGIIPTVLIKNSRPVATVKEKDVLIFFNFNPRGMGQIVQAFSLPSLAKFPERKKYFPDLFIACMTEYEKYLPVKVIFDHPEINATLNKILAENSKKQLFITETEKYPYLNYFFNGFQYFFNGGDNRILISAEPTKDVYGSQEISAEKITAVAIKEIKKGAYDFIALNYGSADILADSGKLEAVIAGLKAIDKNIGNLRKVVLSVGGTLIITSSHGNCEEMVSRHSEEMNEKNTNNPVPFILANNNLEGISLNKADAAGIDLSDLKPTGSLLDIAPTILKIMGIKKPDEMEGKSLL